MFLLVYCLFGEGDVVWGGTIEQRAYDPFKNGQRAKIEEPGDMLGESLLRLIMATSADLQGQHDFDTVAKIITKLADERFWEYEINNRISFIRTTQDKLRRKKLHARKKHRALIALDYSLERLVGKDSQTGMQAQDLTAWIRAWLADLRRWNSTEMSAPARPNILEAMATLGATNGFIYNAGFPPALPVAEQRRDVGTEDGISASEFHPERAGMPDTPRSIHILQGLRSTEIVQNYLTAKGLGLEHIVNSAKRLRFDRPTMSLTESKPELTVSMMIAHGESIGLISESVRRIIGLGQPRAAIQLIVWVYGTGGSYKQLNIYRNMVAAQLVRETAATNVRLRSSIINSTDRDIDRVIEGSLADMAFAYWKCKIPADHKVFVINSRNELLRWGTFWQFMRGEHKIPRQPFESYLQVLHESATPRAKTLPITADDDAEATAQVRRYLAEVTPFSLRLSLPRKTPTAAMLAAMKRARLTWLQLDDLTYNMEFHDPRGEDAITSSKTVICIPVRYKRNLPSNKHAIAANIIAAAKGKADQRTNCLVVVYGDTAESWADIQQYRSQLMKIIVAHRTSENIVFTSLVHCTRSTDNTAPLKQRILAVARYAHWLQNHNQKPTISWQEYDKG